MSSSLIIRPPVTIQANPFKERSNSITKDTERLKDKCMERPRTPGTMELSPESHIVEKVKKENGEIFDRLYTKGRFIGKVFPL